MKPQNKPMHCRISPRSTCNPCGYTMKISSRYHRLFIYEVKRTTKIDGMGPFNYSLLALLLVVFIPSKTIHLMIITLGLIHFSVGFHVKTTVQIFLISY